MDFVSLLQDTVAYKTVEEDAACGRLSHAYLLLSADKDNLGEFLKVFAKLIAGKDERARSLIDGGVHPDVFTFPKKGDAMLKEDVSALIEESFLKPVEGDKKLFLIRGGESMNASSQNKLLKTLEEPPRGVHIIIGATSEYLLLSTLKSRAKRLTIPPFTAEKLFDALSVECGDAEKLKKAIAAADGIVGKALKLYGDENFSETLDLATATICDMRSSREVLRYSYKIAGLADGAAEFVSVLGLLIRDLIAYNAGAKDSVFDKDALEKTRRAQGFNDGALIYAADRIAEAQRRLNANGNPQTVIEWLLFAILEGKHKWQKL